ncbi:MAG TPA: hypothetical protein VFR84_04085 [Candidatus Angelobacter sp.]|nr:hypothetical protein [Candidatus Angelobacter sp.]
MLWNLAPAQGTPPHDPSTQTRQVSLDSGTPPQAPQPPQPRLAQMKNLIKTQVRRALDGKPYPALQDWQPLTGREKFDYFLHSTYAPRTFVNAGVDVISNRIKGRDRNPEYETGLMGLGQHYGIELATAETDVFFKRFLFPALLRQDPRYFRNPDLPFFKRALYSMTRVVITRTDSGGETFNSSSFLGAFSARALGDLYVPGQRQGMHPLTGCISYNLLRDAGMNLVHEFWPDFRRKFLHR